MSAELISNGLQYTGYALEFALLVLLLNRGYGRGLGALCFYVAALFGVDALARPFVIVRYGVHSIQYGYCYWFTDALLALGAFMLICAFFKRAVTARDIKTWALIRPVLFWVLVFVVGISAFAIQHYGRYVTSFVFNFSENLYFTGAILNTVLYVMLNRFAAADSQLHLLVSGLGIQYAGPAATFALDHLTVLTHPISNYLGPVFTLAMLGVWVYAVYRVRHSGGDNLKGNSPGGHQGKRRSDRRDEDERRDERGGERRAIPVAA